MDMVERVARKIARMVPINGSEWCEGHGHNFPREYHRDDVLLILAISRAAIEALREPTQDMVDDMNDVLIDDPEYGPFHPSMEDCGELWRKAIDSILKSTRETA